MKQDSSVLPWEAIPGIFSSNPHTRLSATIEHSNRFINEPIEWPYGNWGAANAYVVLLGPSPGRNYSGERNTNPAVIGGCRIEFKEGTNRNANWRALNMACFGSIGTETMCDRLSALHNLALENSSREDGIKESLVDGCPAEWARLLQAKPVIVATLSYRTFDCIRAHANSVGVDCRDEVPDKFEAYGKPLPAFSVRLCDGAFRTLFLKTPQHPSRPLPRYKDRQPDTSDFDIRTKPIRIAVDWFLKRGEYVQSTPAGAG